MVTLMSRRALNHMTTWFSRWLSTSSWDSVYFAVAV